MEDIGIFGALVNLSSQAIVHRETIFKEFKGALAEQLAFQELKAAGVETINCWSNGSATAEIDFLTQDSEGNVVPIEVKSGINLRSKSLAVYQEKFDPAYSIRLSLADAKFNKESKTIDVPLFAVGILPSILASAGRVTMDW